MDGRYGPYVKWDKINATLPDGTDPQDVTLDMAVPLLAEKAAKSGKKAPAKKTTAKKAPAKKVRPRRRPPRRLPPNGRGEEDRDQDNRQPGCEGYRPDRDRLICTRALARSPGFDWSFAGLSVKMRFIAEQRTDQ